MTRADREDQRVRRASLTRAGLHERKELDRRSNELALSILEALSARQRDRLMTATGEVEGLLQASMVCFAIEDPTSADARIRRMLRAAILRRVTCSKSRS
jgi:DNA-binding MarR family transcriptional regulator